MHQVLLIDELLHLILIHLPLSSLARFARSARIFHLPAAMHIWKSLDIRSMKWLMRIVLEPHFVGEQPLPLIHRWNRFHLYAALVRRLQLSLDFEGDTELHAMLQTLTSLYSPFDGNRLLPALRSFDMHATQPEDIDCAMHFIGPSLNRIQITGDMGYVTFDRSDYRVQALLCSIRHEAPLLKSLSLFAVPLELFHLRAMGGMITSLPLLTSFSTDAIALTHDVFCALGRQPKLEKLYLNGLEEIWALKNLPSLLSMNVPRTGFLALKRLHADGHIDLITALLSSINGGLQTLSVESHLTNLASDEKEFSAMRLSHLVEAVVSFSGSLVSIVVSLEEFITHPREQAITLDIFTPFRNCRSLTRFDLEYWSATPIDFRDSHVASLAMAWPSLKNFSVTWMPTVVQLDGIEGGLLDESALTLAAVSSLAVHCSRLQYVHLTAFDTTKIPIPPHLQNTPLPMQLDVGVSCATQIPYLALFLTSLWPELTVTHRLDSDEQVEMWGFVASLIYVVRCHDQFKAAPEKLLSRTGGSFLDTCNAIADEYVKMTPRYPVA